MRIMVVHNRYRSALPSGEDQVVDQEYELLKAAGHDVTLFEKRSDDVAEMSLADKARMPLKIPWNRSVRDELYRALLHSPVDIVHLHNLLPLLSTSVLRACWDVGVPVVATLHNYMQVCPVGTLMRDGKPCNECTNGAPIPALIHGCYRNSRIATMPMAANAIVSRKKWAEYAPRMLCVSEFQRRILVNSGVTEDRMKVKPHFVPEPGVQRYGPGEYVLYLGRMTKDKGVDLLMRAWDAGGFDVPLVMAGLGPLADEVSSWASRRTNVSYLGLRTRGECVELLRRASVLVAPSRASETFGLVVVEAMSVGVPVVAAAHGGFEEIVEDDLTGELHPVGDSAGLQKSLFGVTSNSDRNVSMGKRAREAYERRFSPTVGIRRLEEEYAEAVMEYSSRIDERG